MKFLEDLTRTLNDSSQVAVFLDESELGIDRNVSEGRACAYIYAIGATVIEDGAQLSPLERELGALREGLANAPSMRGRPEEQRFRESGWHLTEDLPNLSVPLWDKMGQELGVKYHYRYFESPVRIDSSSRARVYAILYAHLAMDLFRRYSGSELHFRFEQYDDLNAHYSGLVSWSHDRAERLLRQRYRDGSVELEEAEVSIVKKGEYNCSALTDYMILGLSRVLAASATACATIPSCAGGCRRTVFAGDDGKVGHLDGSNRYARDYQQVRDAVSSAVAVRLHPGVLV